MEKEEQGSHLGHFGTQYARIFNEQDGRIGFLEAKEKGIRGSRQLN